MYGEQKRNSDAVPGPSTCLTEQEVFQTKHHLLNFLKANTPQLYNSIRMYVQRLGLASGEQVQGIALEVLQETVVEALAHADRFTSGGQPTAWLLGIALNMIKRKKVENAKRHQRELQFSHLIRLNPDLASEDELLDSLVTPASVGPEHSFEANEQAAALLALVSEEDQRVLRMVLLEGFEREELAQVLGITVGTARMRLHRALARLRTAWRKNMQEEDEHV